MTGSAGSKRQPSSASALALVYGLRCISRTHLTARRRLTDCRIAPTSPHPVGRASTPARRGLTGNVISPHRRLHQPLSHAASRRDSSPFRGAEGWAEVRGVYASVYHDAATYVSHPPVRGGVPDAPCSRDCRAGLVASVRPDRQHPRLPRRDRFRPPPHASKSRGHSPRTISNGRTDVVLHPKPGGRGSPPLRWVAPVDWQRYYAALTLAATPQSRRFAPRQLPFQGSRGVGGGLRRLCICLPRC